MTLSQNGLRNEPVHRLRVVPASRLDWLATGWGFGWTVCWIGLMWLYGASAPPDSSRVTLIGHSSGGVMLPYLSGESFCGRRYGGADRCNRLITLAALIRRCGPLPCGRWSIVVFQAVPMRRASITSPSPHGWICRGPWQAASAAAVRPVPTGRSVAIHMWTVMVWCRSVPRCCVTLVRWF